MDSPTCQTMRIVTSTMPPSRSAATKASGTAISNASTAAIAVSISVIGIRSAMSCVTGACSVIELPRRSVATCTR